MRTLFALCAVLGLAGIVIGGITIVRGMAEQPFNYEYYGGPGPIIAGVVMVAASLYLRSIWQGRE
jgi:hypothetical protein